MLTTDIELTSWISPESFGSDIDLVTHEPGSTIVRDHTLDEIIETRRLREEALTVFNGLSIEEVRRELQSYQGFLVQVADGDYSLVLGFMRDDPQTLAEPTVLLARP